MFVLVLSDEILWIDLRCMLRVRMAAFMAVVLPVVPAGWPGKCSQCPECDGRTEQPDEEPVSTFHILVRI